MKRNPSRLIGVSGDTISGRAQAPFVSLHLGQSG